MGSQDHLKYSGLRRALSPATLLPAVAAGGSNAIIIISVEISFAAMLFAGALGPFMGRGIGILLFGSFLISLVTALKSSHPSAIALAQDAPVAVLVGPLAGIAAAMASADPESIFYTAVCTMVLSTLAVGLLMLVMARFRLGNFVRFIPYPVIGGFLAGIGWLLVKGGIGVMAGVSTDLASLSGLFAQAAMVKWVPGAAFALLLLLLLRRFSHFLILPGMVLGAILVFFLGMKLAGIPYARAEALGWFLGPFPQGALWSPMTLTDLSRVRWDLVLGQSLTMVSIFIISVISLLLNASGLELVSRSDIDLNKEMKVAGFSNILAAFTGSSPGYMALATSALCHKLSPGNRLAGVIFSLMLLAALVFGPVMVSVFPRPLAGAMLVLIGVDMLWDWAWSSRCRLPKTDYALILLILAVVGCFGFLQGVGAGVVVAVLLFVVSYSRISIVRSCISGRHFQSNVERAAPLRWILNQKGGQIVIFQLQGFIFFGTANQLRAKIQEQAGASPEIRYVLLDFSKVSGCDSSAMNSFERIRQFCETRGITLVFVQIARDLSAPFDISGFPPDQVRRFADLDQGMEWCEDQILANEKQNSSLSRDQVLECTFEDMCEALGQMEAFENLVADMAPFLKEERIDTGVFLFRKGEVPEGIYLIESGKISILLEQEGGPTVRLRTMGAGSVVGEWGNPAESSVVGVMPGRVFQLSERQRQAMEQQAPELASRLYKHMVQVLSERLARSKVMIQDLIRETPGRQAGED